MQLVPKLPPLTEEGGKLVETVQLDVEATPSPLDACAPSHTYLPGRNCTDNRQETGTFTFYNQRPVTFKIVDQSDEET